MNTLHFTAFATSFLLAYLLIPYLSKFAQHYQLVDKPNSRKVHVYPVPLIGGISIFFAVGLTLVLSIPFGFKLWDHKNIIAALSILVLIGTIDDKYDIRASLKLAIQLLLAHFLFLQGLKIESLHGLFGVFEIHTDLQYLITILMVTGVVNAFNLMDGVDGLMAGISLIGFITFTCLAVLLNQTILALIFLSFIGALLAFLKYNLSIKSKIFMGDAGSLMIGLVFAASSLLLLQKGENSPYLSIVFIGVVAVLFIPVLDALRVFRKRAKMGKSPLAADKTHLHHLILSKGMKHKTVALFITLIMLGLMFMAFLTHQWVGLTLSLVCNLIVFYSLTSFLQLQANLISWKEKIGQMETAYQ